MQGLAGVLVDVGARGFGVYGFGVYGFGVPAPCGAGVDAELGGDLFPGQPGGTVGGDRGRQNGPGGGGQLGRRRGVPAGPGAGVAGLRPDHAGQQLAAHPGRERLGEGDPRPQLVDVSAHHSGPWWAGELLAEPVPGAVRLRWAVTPFSGDPDAIADEDAWRTCAAAVRALADNHAPDLNLAP
jgi:hypothetical protein